MDYDTMSANLKQIDPALHEALVAKCQENLWLKRGGIPFEDDPYLELDSPYSFVEARDLDTLEAFFLHGNWSIRQGIVYGDLVFVNQVNGGDEWWTLKLDRKTNQYVAFESITFRLIIEHGEFTEYISRLERATIEQCKRLDY